jgi:hypothetical protein
MCLFTLCIVHAMLSTRKFLKEQQYTEQLGANAPWQVPALPNKRSNISPAEQYIVSTAPFSQFEQHPLIADALKRVAIALAPSNEAVHSTTARTASSMCPDQCSLYACSIAAVRF